MPINTKGFQRGNRVFHVNGGTGEIRTFENDWKTDPPTVMVVVRVTDTIFHTTRTVKLNDLRKDRRKTK